MNPMHRWKVDIEAGDEGALAFVVTIFDRRGEIVAVRRLRDGESPDVVAIGMITTMQRNGVLA